LDVVKEAGHGDEQSGWPLAKADRPWTRRRLFVVLVVAASATWCFIIGQYVGSYLNLKMGFAALTAGALIGMLLVTLAVVPTAARFGIDSIAAAKPQFGDRGWIVTVFLQYASIIGWNALLLIFFGKSVAQLLATLAVVAPDSSGVVIRVASAAACVAIYLVLVRGVHGVERLAQVLFFFIVGIGAWMIVTLLTNQAEAIAAAKPELASGNLQWDYVTGVEIGLASLLSWWPYLGALVREAPDAHTAVLPSMIGIAPPGVLLCLAGIAATLALKVADPSAWLVELGGPVYGVIALLFLIAASLGAATIGVYATAIGLRHVPVLAKLGWSPLLLIGLVPVAAVAVGAPELFFASLGTFLAFLGVFFAPLCALQIVDCFLLRRHRISLRGIYQEGPNSPYHYWGGFNPAALLGMAGGFITYLYLLNPVTYASRWPYEYLTASLPTALVGGIVYLIVTLLVVKPAAKGDY
jgi:NCS1 family nucleobase:cation symporter-1